MVEAGLTKAEVRELSREHGTPDVGQARPGLPVVPDTLWHDRHRGGPYYAVAKAEEFLRGLGLRQLRVRHHDTIARIEVEPDDLPLMVREEVREAVV